MKSDVSIITLILILAVAAVLFFAQDKWTGVARAVPPPLGTGCCLCFDYTLECTVGLPFDVIHAPLCFDGVERSQCPGCEEIAGGVSLCKFTANAECVEKPSGEVRCRSLSADSAP